MSREPTTDIIQETEESMLDQILIAKAGGEDVRDRLKQLAEYQLNKEHGILFAGSNTITKYESYGLTRSVFGPATDNNAINKRVELLKYTYGIHN